MPLTSYAVWAEEYMESSPRGFDWMEDHRLNRVWAEEYMESSPRPCPPPRALSQMDRLRHPPPTPLTSRPSWPQQFLRDSCPLCRPSL